MNKHFPEIKKNFGFGCMRLPKIGEDIDQDAFCAMIDKFIDSGFNYFDTARPYHGGMSEKMLKTCLAERHDRSEFLLANKLSFFYFEKEADIRPLIDDQLATCGVEYFDFYLMHAMSAERHQKYLDTHAYDIAQEYKRAGKLRHVGMSFHDSAEALDKILTDRPELEFVQLQFNYADYNDPKVQSRLCYEVCRKHNKPVWVMEPVKGGTLVNLPKEALELLPDGSPASYAIRYAASFEGITMVLSGMSNMEQMEDNLSYMADFKPLSEKEHEIIDKVRTLYQAQHKIPCTACRYCVDGCPAGIPIPDIFALQNAKLGGEEYDAAAYGNFAANATDCVDCGQCEGQCPQTLQIRDLLKEVHKGLWLIAGRDVPTMEIRKELLVDGGKRREYIFFKVAYNGFRDVSTSITTDVRDQEEMTECECVLCLPDRYTDDGEETPLILSFHGAGKNVCAESDKIGGLAYVQPLIDAGYAALDVSGSKPHGLTHGCPEHIFAAYKAYRYAIKHYNLSEKVLIAGASMGGQTSMNFANTFPSLVLAVGMFYPLLHMDGVTVGDHYCIGTWDKTTAKNGGASAHDRIIENFRFPDDRWHEENTLGFNPHHTRSFVNADGERVIIPPCPIKIWQGTADTVVDPVYVEEYVRAVRRSGSYIEFHLMEGIPHAYTPEMGTELLYWFNRFI